MSLNIVDRWRGKGTIPFVVAIDVANEDLVSTLLAANLRMDELGRSSMAAPGTGSVDVILMGTRWKLGAPDWSYEGS
ncbi:MAG: hypothetical protein R2826_03515 [Thermoleophilia bacterium]